ncbi:platelet endothelial aggregation receptor 1-like [Petaurus breviceps papuanus]|uniref:platelet endothelial aggregation receptor 1-like n=1 Tax=Petaurus breviceps papuanus TaxID=3040969 RepID=UPI0036DB50F1
MLSRTLPPLTVLFLLLPGQGSTLNPNDPNVCSYWESYTTTMKESYSHPYTQLPTEPCNQPWGHDHSCPQPKIVYRTAYRQAVKVDHRRRLRCCQGYYESTGACVRESSQTPPPPTHPRILALPATSGPQP